MKYKLYVLLCFIILISFTSGQLSYFINSNKQQCKSGFTEIALPEPMKNSSHCSDNYCDFKCIDSKRLSIDFCGKEFDLIDSTYEKCCEGLEIQNLNPVPIYTIRCDAQSGTCNAKCIDTIRVEKERRYDFIFISLFAFLLISFILWIFIVGILLFIRFWNTYYPGMSFIKKYYITSFKVGLSIIGIGSYDECNCKSLIWQYRIAIIIILMIFIGAVFFS
jgi:hypothetical protein